MFLWEETPLDGGSLRPMFGKCCQSLALGAGGQSFRRRRMKAPIRRIPVKDVPLVDTHLEQTCAWIVCRNVHVRVGGSWECCPDFSCCYPDCAVAPAVREGFAAADAPRRMEFYAKFLADFVRMVSDRPMDVHVVGSTDRRGKRR